jgi:hypothetical protein
MRGFASAPHSPFQYFASQSRLWRAGHLPRYPLKKASQKLLFAFGEQAGVKKASQKLLFALGEQTGVFVQKRMLLRIGVKGHDAPCREFEGRSPSRTKPKKEKRKGLRPSALFF